MRCSHFGVGEGHGGEKTPLDEDNGCRPVTQSARLFQGLFYVCWHASCPAELFGRLWHRAADRMPDKQDWPSNSAQKRKATRKWLARMCYDGWVGHCTQNALALLASEHSNGD